MKGLDCKQPGGNPSGQTTAEPISAGRVALAVCEAQ